MGLLTHLVTLPLAPVRGVAWIAGRVGDAAVQESGGAEALQQELWELRARYEEGELSEAEYTAAEDELVELLMATRRATDFEEETHG